MTTSDPVRGADGERLAVLHLLLTMGETTAGYNEHCLPEADVRDITVCTYFRPQVRPPDSITVYAGDSTLAGFTRAIRAALTAREYDVVHAHSVHMSVFFMLAASALRPRLLASSACTLHSSYPNYKLRNRLMLVPSFALHRRVVCCSAASYASFPSWLRRLGGDRVRVVANGLDLRRVDQAIARPRPAQEPRPFTVVSVGRLIEVKDPVTAVQAFSRAGVEPARMVFVGEGPLADRVATGHGGTDAATEVSLTGLVPRESVYERLLESDVFLSTSRIEGLPVSVLEAMACGRPVVLSDIPAHREIAAGVDVIPLVPVGDVAGFARELGRLAQLSARERAEIGARCREVVERRFSLDAMRSGYDRVYREVLGQQDPAADAPLRATS